MDFLKSILPTLATAIGGPLAGGAVQFFADKLGIDDKTVEGVVAAVKGATPEQLAKMKELDNELRAKYIDAGIKLEEIAAADRSNARGREIATGDSWTPRLLAAIIVSGYLAVQWFILNHVVPPEMRELVLRSMGTLDMALGLVLGYYFGSSAGSAHARQLLADK